MEKSDAKKPLASAMPVGTVLIECATVAKVTARGVRVPVDYTTDLCSNCGALVYLSPWSGRCAERFKEVVRIRCHDCMPPLPVGTPCVENLTGVAELIEVNREPRA